MSLNKKKYTIEQQKIIARKKYIQDTLLWIIENKERMRKNYSSSKEEIKSRKKHLEKYIPKKEIVEILIQQEIIKETKESKNELYNFIDSLNTNIYTCIDFIESQKNNIKEIKIILSDIIWSYHSFKLNLEWNWRNKTVIKIQNLSMYISKLEKINSNISWLYEFHIYEKELYKHLNNFYKYIKSLDI